jgi:hypothetical protein
MMRPVATGWAWTAITLLSEVVDPLLETDPTAMLGRPLSEPRLLGRDVISGPMMPSAARGIGIVADDGKAAGLRRLSAPFERRRQVFAIAGEAAGNGLVIRESAGSELHNICLSHPAPNRLTLINGGHCRRDINDLTGRH